MMHGRKNIKLVDTVTAGSQKITLWGPQSTHLGILRVNLSCFVNFTISALCNIPCIFCYETIIFLYNLPVEYSEGTHFSEVIFRASTP